MCVYIDSSLTYYVVLACVHRMLTSKHNILLYPPQPPSEHVGRSTASKIIADISSEIHANDTGLNEHNPHVHRQYGASGHAHRRYVLALTS